MIDSETVDRIEELFDRPVWEDPPKVVAQVHPDDHDAVREAWRERFGEAPLHLRTTSVQVPPEKLDMDGNTFRETRAHTEPADLVLVDARAPEWAEVWEAEGFDVRELEV